MLVELPDDFVANIRKLAKKPMDFENDDFEVYGFCGSNVDDAYARGEEQGELQAARDLARFFPEED